MMIHKLVRFLALLAVVSLAPPAARAFDFEPIKPIDLKSVDPAMIKDTYGAWEIRDARNKRRCRVILKPDSTIGGYAIEIDRNCAKSFPIMNDITAWRLLEGWTIDLVDALRKTRVRFSTPDERYVAIPEVDGIFTIVKK